jgi:hypothetical protein
MYASIELGHELATKLRLDIDPYTTTTGGKSGLTGIQRILGRQEMSRLIVIAALLFAFAIVRPPSGAVASVPALATA